MGPDFIIDVQHLYGGTSLLWSSGWIDWMLVCIIVEKLTM